ncbi:MAG: (2Fe-2S)-binding protein, partial [Steroidobacteraceae bacterium]
SGEIAGIGIALDAGRLSNSAAEEQTRRQRNRLAKVRRFAGVLAQLAKPAPSTLAELAHRSAVLCRCEDVTVAALMDAIAAHPEVASASTAKLLTRVGMGLCQGRMCEISVRRLIAQLRGRAVSEIPGYVVRAPVKPVPVALLASERGALDIDPTASSP